MNHNTVHARVLVDEVLRAGVTDLCLAPGSRSTPVVLAAAEAARDRGLRVRVFLDERSAAFFALGLGRATGRPAAVLTTSGTAVANLLPAVVEAAASEVPMLLLTADRPGRLRGADANQVIDQPRIFGDYPVWASELPAASLDDADLRHLRATVARAVAVSLGLPAGPVHLNLPYAKPLEPGPGDPGAAALGESGSPGRAGRPDGAPWTRISKRRPRIADDQLDRFIAASAAAERPVIVAGAHPESGVLGPALRRWARRWGVPVLADPLAGARYGMSDDDPVITAYDLFLRDPGVGQALRPDRIVRVGAAPTSASLLAWMASHGDVEQVVIDAGRRWKDHQSLAHEMIRACPIDLCERALARWEAEAAPTWAARWMDADRAAAAGALAQPDGTDAHGVHEGRIAADVVQALPADTPLFVSSSMPIRDVDGYGGGTSEPLSVHGNRGASGIDGILSTALGVAAGAGRTGVAIVGDLAFLHDVNGLLAAREADANVVFVLVHNDGGGIFHMLPIRDHEPAFTPYFATPHGAEPAQGAAMYGVTHHRVAAEAVGDAVWDAVSGRETVVLEVRSERESNRAAHRRSEARAMAAVRTALGLD